MTKLDGDSRGGAALSIRKVTGKPIKFLGLGEDLERLEEFRPEGLASRILGLGDIVGLMQDFERVAEETTEQDQMRMLQGQFNFKDFYEQLSMIQKMGSLKDLMAKLPLGGLPKDINLDDKELVRIKAMISSMTEKERLQPSLIDESRGRRIAKGSGRKLQEVSDLIKKFKQMRQMMGTLGKSLGMLSRIPGMGALKQMGQMKQMAQAMMSGGGGFPAGLNPAMAGGMADLLGGGMRGAPGTPKPVDRDKLRKKKKAERKARKKNRKK
jgi:signal recognition particle subunit SRP54